MNRNTTTPRNLSLRERRQEAVRLRKEGRTFQEIADRLGYANRSAARNALLTELDARVAADIDDLRQREAERLDEVQDAIWVRVLRGDIDAIKTFLLIAARRARLLGLDAPQRLEVKAQARYAILQLGQGRPPRIIDLEAPDLTALADDELDVLRAPPEPDRREARVDNEQ